MIFKKWFEKLSSIAQFAESIDKKLSNLTTTSQSIAAKSNLMHMELSSISEQLEDVLDMMAGTLPPSPVEPPIEPPPGETPDWYGWWDMPDSTYWLREIDGQKVAFLVLNETVPLQEFEFSLDENEELFAHSFRPFESIDLRSTSSPINTNSRRVIPKAGRIVMAYKLGNEYELNEHPWFSGDKSARPYKGDGGNDIFIVMKEQIIDGIRLWDNPATSPENVILGVFSRDVAKIIY